MLGGAIDEAPLAQVVEHEHAALVERHQVGIAVAVEVARAQRAHGAGRHARQRALAHRFERTGERVAQEVEASAVARGGEIEIAFLVVVERQHARVAAARESERGALVAEAALAVAAPEREAATGREQVARAVVVEIESEERRRRGGRRHRDRLGETVASETDLERARRPRDQARDVGLVVAVEIRGDQPARAGRAAPSTSAARSSIGTGRPKVVGGGSSTKRATGTPCTSVVSSLSPPWNIGVTSITFWSQDRRPPRRLEIAGLERVDHRRDRVCAAGSACHASSRMRR